MARLPIPGSDDGVWGAILNEFLSVELNGDGTLKKAPDIVQAVQDANSSLQTAQQAQQSADNAVSTANTASTTANAAQTSADAAQTTADSAQTTANNALAGLDAKLNITAALGYVDVETGNEPRPNNARVLWIGGTTQPVNMENLDVWLEEV